MCWPGPRSQAGVMNTNTVNPEARLHAGPPFGAGSRRTALRRPVQDSMLAGVAAGLARYLGVDVMIIRLAFVVLTIVGAAGIPLYLAGLLLIPQEGSEVSIASSLTGSLRSRSR
jgi:phage shock protein PspC (stress-responsive transcriptional regulator)